jgi:hypothetical protein
MIAWAFNHLRYQEAYLIYHFSGGWVLVRKLTLLGHQLKLLDVGAAALMFKSKNDYKALNFTVLRQPGAGGN